MLKFIFLLLIFTSCFSSKKYNLNDCFQKPDEGTVWKLKDANETHFILEDSNGKVRQEKSIGGYVDLDCNF